MKKISKVLGKPYLLLIAILLTAGVFLFSRYFPGFQYKPPYPWPSLYAEPVYISETAYSDSGALAYHEYSASNDYILLVDAQGNTTYFFQDNNLFVPRALCFDDQDNLYIYGCQFLEDCNVVYEDRIVYANPETREFEPLYKIDYSESENPPTRWGRLSNLSFSDGVLHFAYTDEEKTEILSLDPHTGDRQTLATYTTDSKGDFIVKSYIQGDICLFLTGTGALYRTKIGKDLTEPIYQFSLELDNIEEGFFPYALSLFQDEIYFISFGSDTGLYRLEGDEIAFADDLSRFYGEDALPVIQTMSPGTENMLVASEDGLFLFDGTEFTPIQTIYPLGMQGLLSGIFPYIKYALYALTFVLLVLYIIFVRKTILTKQMLILIPTIIVMIGIIYYFMSKLNMHVYESMLVDESISVCELFAQNVDGDGLKGITGNTDINTDALLHARKQLYEMSHYNRSDWSEKYDIQIAVNGNDELPYCLINTSTLNAPLDTIALDEPTYYKLIESTDTGTTVYQSYGEDGNYYATTPIFASDGSYVANLYVCTNTYSMYGELTAGKRRLWYVMIPFSIALIAIMSFLAARMTGTIRKASDTVSKIADGDLTARIETKSRDELGDICRQVNSMAISLDHLFEENQKKEAFYYKFVPEKFRELLGKDNITDLQLGDAKSREFTVLFCDIRSFSLNSEMLTAKENFEFVNIIYGIAGPIIRKYNGFVDKYIGDAVMALFDSAESAILAGQEIYQAVVLNPGTAEQLHVSSIKVGVGIHTGIARIGIVGESERLSGTVISNSVNISSRLESLTKTYKTAMILTKETLDKIKDPDRMNLRYLGMVQVAGVNEVKSLYEALDCLEPKERDLRTSNKEDFREAVRLFHLGDRDGAIRMFTEIQEQGRADSVVDMYLTYLTELSPEDKANVFRFTKK